MSTHIPTPHTEDEFTGQSAPPAISQATRNTEGSIPNALAPMVGRRRERLAVSDFLRNPEIRLLVLTGPGGVGKTRLALSVVDALRESFPDGVCFVDLSPLSRSDLVLPTIADNLGVRLSTNVPLINAINATIRSRRC